MADYTNYTYRAFFGKTYRVDLRQPYQRRRRVAWYFFVGVFTLGMGLAISPFIPDAEPCGLNEPRCYDHTNYHEFLP